MRSETEILTCRRAFSLLELVAVMILLGVLVGLIAPRAMNLGQREAVEEAERVQRLVTVAARKEALTTVLFALEYDGQAGDLRIVRRDAGDQRWVEDPYVEPVGLDHLTLVDAEADGVSLDDRGWRVMMNSADVRPVLSLLLVEDGAAGEAGWQIDLLPASAEASMRFMSDRVALRDVRVETVDLDDAGRGDEAW